ncbi:hypothetical protein B0H21DRAFT_125479 [Amylocystis lapponica]|nr:hypothetical protein B0H21DRAFT_125479 [Amylocystis lapponica]
MHAALLTQSAGSACRVLARIFLASWPFAIPAGMYLCRHCGSTIWPSMARVGVWSSHLYSKFRAAVTPSRAHVRRPSAEEEETYWREAEQYRKILEPSDSRATPHAVPLVRYYVPRLLPEYRSPRRDDAEASEYHLSAKTFCKWHRMVFRGPLHPTLKQAEKLIENYSSRDRQQMHSISRMQTDMEVFARTVPWTPRFRDMWKRWLDTKGVDVAIVFS